jgi:ATP-dependent DNA helicase 2 subunit 2
VPPKAKGKRGRDIVKPLSGLDVEALLGREKRAKITTENAIPEFKQMLETAEDLSSIQEAAKQMATIIRSLITHSLGDSGYGRAIANIATMREELINMEEPDLYNDFVADLKRRLLAGELGGDRRDMMWEIRKAKLGLIDKKASEISEVTEDQATEVSMPILLKESDPDLLQFYSMRELPHRSV